MYSLIWPFTAIFVRPSTWTYLISPSYSAGRILGEGLRGLVHVVVGVEDRKVEFA
jgi:hypothetical protein